MDFDTDRLRDVKDAITETVGTYAQERREKVDELAAYGGGGKEGYAFAALALSRNYDAAADLIDEDPERVEQDVDRIVDDLYADARKGKQVAREARDEARDVLTPLKETYRDDDADLTDMVDAAKQVKEDATRRVQERAVAYAMDRAMRQMEEDMEDAFGDLEGMFDELEDTDGGDVDGLFDLDGEGDDPLGLGGAQVPDGTHAGYDDSRTYHDETPDEPGTEVATFLARDDVFDAYQQVRTVVDRIEDPDAFAEALAEDAYEEAVEHTTFADADTLREAFTDAEDARTTLLEKAFEELDADQVSELQDDLDQLYGR